MFPTICTVRSLFFDGEELIIFLPEIDSLFFERRQFDAGDMRDLNKSCKFRLLPSPEYLRYLHFLCHFHFAQSKDFQ